MVLICIFQITNEVEHFVMSLLGLWTFFYDAPFKPFAHVSTELARGFLYAFLRVLHILDTNILDISPLLAIRFVNICSHFGARLFTLFILS